MIIKVFDSVPQSGVFPCKDVITKVKSVVWNDRFYKTGNFQLSLPDTDLKPMDVIQLKNRAGLVLKVVKSTSAEVYGYDLKCLFNFRYFNAEATYSGTAEEILYAVARDLLKTGDREIEGLTVPTTPYLNLSETVTLNAEVKGAADVLYEFCLNNELGYDVSFNEETGYTLAALKGRDMTDKINFSRKERNLDSAEYTSDLMSLVNVAYTKERTEGAGTGINRREGSKIAEAVETLRGTANDRLEFGKDWLLGDYVTVTYKDFTAKKQITEVKTVIEPNNKKTIPVFGTEKENPISKILKQY